MDRIEKILLADDDIEKKIMALRSEVSDVEARIIDNILIERLEKENRELEEEIQKYRNELTQLELANGRRQIAFANILQQVKINEVVSTKENAGEENSKDSVTPQSVSKTDDVAYNVESKKVKKEQKKVEKTDKVTYMVIKKKGDKSETKKDGTEEPPVDVGRLDLRVGKIVHIEKHPGADSLYVEKVNIGRKKPITVVSGLVKHIPIEDMQDSLVIIFTNLIPAKMRGITSEGMVMCACNDGVVEVLRPPSESVPGDVVSCSGYTNSPDPQLNPRKRIFETVAPDLKTDSETIATYKGERWSIGSKGFVKAQTLKGASIK
ncbi:aminoacyl tRNA synthase complex-interacting multifunctional protein 1 isoform X2 [Halyomorpha halys]|uniref:aminoacyl tRNA synthase complex-interacting multifunctional protein 1 isoform X2 n=1 Tax=Halyomorpha halys TaxID=286706 RepID=UPI0006D508E4|nr:aminoacyl tRNA synthase complex-interacting multifunctional protein 1 isoform X2 [Halyomorpha halys]